jgi:hypothetical protein
LDQEIPTIVNATIHLWEIFITSGSDAPNNSLPRILQRPLMAIIGNDQHVSKRSAFSGEAYVVSTYEKLLLMIQAVISEIG